MTKSVFIVGPSPTDKALEPVLEDVREAARRSVEHRIVHCTTDKRKRAAVRVLHLFACELEDEHPALADAIRSGIEAAQEELDSARAVNTPREILAYVPTEAALVLVGDLEADAKDYHETIEREAAQRGGELEAAQTGVATARAASGWPGLTAQNHPTTDEGGEEAKGAVTLEWFHPDGSRTMRHISLDELRAGGTIELTGGDENLPLPHPQVVYGRKLRYSWDTGEFTFDDDPPAEEPAHDFTQEEIEAVRRYYQMRREWIDYYEECLLPQQLDMEIFAGESKMPFRRMLAIARYLADKEKEG